MSRTGRIDRLGLLLLLAFAASGCKREAMLFHAGVGQRSSLREIEQLFQRAHPGARVDFSFKGSGYFLPDLSRSQQGDLFMPGEEYYLLQAVERGFVTDYDPARDVAARFVTVILTPAGNPKQIRSLADFARPGVRVGLGNPDTCAIGRWHQKTFQRAGLWDAVRANQTLSAKCIPELGNAAQHGLVDATVVWSSTAVLYLRDCEIVPIEPALRGVVRLPVAPLRFSRQPERARQLQQLILSDAGRDVFRRHAYAVGPVATDDQGFLRAGETGTDDLMRWLTAAAAAVKAADWPEAARGAVGPLAGEVERQRRTLRSGD